MTIITGIVLILLGYFFGSLPSGLVIVRLTTGRDIRSVGSGRTGGTNAMRAGGALAGLLTGILDVLKSSAAIWICQWVLPGQFWAQALTGLAAVLGHNYSMYLIEWVETKYGKRPIFHGGAGGAPTVGAAFAFWPPSILIVLPIGVLVFLLLGYASMTTLVGGLVVIIIFGIRASLGYSSEWYVLFGILAMTLLVWALRPNITRLFQGTERMVGLRAWWYEQRRQLQKDPCGK
jgi:glycerol-3-phosphate acyltransferase PlsY